ncbi:MAG: hypothetical protein JXA66_05930, partial [Oligoflexia bacterium]|nr:hypothetical protein [Oligoflexia bacterium]
MFNYVIKLVFFMFLICISGSCGNKYKSHYKFRKIQVGETFPGFSGSAVNEKGEEIHISHITPGGKFFIHYIPDLASISGRFDCIDLGCGAEIKTVVEKGGHFLGTADGKFAS